LPAALRGKSYDDAEVIKAYLNYCRRSIKFFKPDYLAIGVEVNEIFTAGPDKWRAYATLHRQIYRELKKEHPDLPVFASYTLHNLFKVRGAMLKACHELMPFNDFVAISFYPFFIGDRPETAFRWLTDNFDSFAKPYAVVETNDTAERTEMAKMKVTLAGTPEKQAAYIRTLLDLAERRRFQFVVLFIHQDYDPLWEAIKGTAPELFMAWRDCGLLDERGQARPAYAVWREYFNRPFGDATQKAKP
jgi:arabinogalactan endo-1,4-beta-galactosidase